VVAGNPMEHLVAAVLRGESVDCPPEENRRAQRRFLEQAGRHGVQPLVAYQLHRLDLLHKWPVEVQQRLKDAARQAALIENVRRRELREVLSALAAIEVQPLLMKGAALAYVHYPSPFLRTCCDIDMLVRSEDVERVAGVMHMLGYHRPALIPGDLVMPQRSFLKRDPSGVWHSYDVHSKIANPQAFANALSFDELASRSVSMPLLGPDARALGRIDALLLACIHRVAHHYSSGRLLWLYDIHLVAGALGPAEFQRFASLAAERKVAAVCMAGLRLAQGWFATHVPADVVATLAAQGSTEPSAKYVDGRLRQVDSLLLDLKALADWRSRCRLIRQHLFPPASYMRERYGVSGWPLLPAVYALRAMRGASGWVRRPAKTRA